MVLHGIVASYKARLPTRGAGMAQQMSIQIDADLFACFV